jgi:CTP-dependent riboflavin kinase
VNQPSGREIRGRLISGKGEAEGFCRLAWFCAQIQNAFGFRPYPGTLNLRLVSEEDVAHWQTLRAKAGVPLSPEPGFCAARCYSVRIEDRIEGAIVLPQIDDYPGDIVELIASAFLRQALAIEDGALVTLRVS